MMNRNDLLASLPSVQQAILARIEARDEMLELPGQSNPWFTPEFVAFALQSIATEFLDVGKCRTWLEAYPDRERPSRRIGLVLAGNLPLVGFHDIFCVLAAGHHAVVKMSEKDNVLLPWLIELWDSYAPGIRDRISLVEKLSGFDAVMATGTNNSSRYFEYYFSRYPRLLRGHRNGVAVLSGEETPAELAGIMRDIFLYFGLGCRNVSALVIPTGYDFAGWDDLVRPWAHLSDHPKYRHNLDYNLALYLINNIPHSHLGPLILKPDEAIASRIGCVHYRTCYRQEDLLTLLESDRDGIQCLVSREEIPGWEVVRPGATQMPALGQYADGVDTMEFLLALD